jgi:hypothetical protein
MFDWVAPMFRKLLIKTGLFLSALAVFALLVWWRIS